ncbi:cellulose biosynthesis protein BcsG [Thiolapillus sp.]
MSADTASTRQVLVESACSDSRTASGMNPGRSSVLNYMGLGAWNAYFLAKFFLYWKHYIGFHPLENLAFAAFLLMPVRSVAGRVLRQLIALPLGVALLYYDSWLPPVARVLDQAGNVGGFSPTYLFELVGRFFDVRLVAILVLIWAGTRILSEYLRIGTLVFTTLIVLLVWQTLEKNDISIPAIAAAGNPVMPSTASTANPSSGAVAGNTPPRSSLDAVLEDFYRRESGRQVNFTASPSADVPFDVLFLHICSLSWDDLDYAGLTSHPLFDRFDLLFTNFNSASSYSGPATVRLLRATCGQPGHHDLYQPAPQHCYLFQNLAQAGFSSQFALNHDGHFDDFLGVVRERGQLDAEPMSLEGITIDQRAFDGSPIHDDLEVLDRWLQRREQGEEARVAAYYNTISLHDGNRLVEGPGRNMNSLKSYPRRLRKLLDDLDRFLHQIEVSGRRMVVVLVPEHGAAIRGDKMQIAGLREIPSPAITRVPAAVAIIGPGLERRGSPIRNDQPVSYLAISHVIERVLQDNIFSGTGFDPAALVKDLPQTPFVSENEGTVVMRYNGRYHLRLPGEDWMEYPVDDTRGAP